MPLPYFGKPDPASLQREIRALRAELNAMRMRGDHAVSDQEIRRLRAESVLFLNFSNLLSEMDQERPSCLLTAYRHDWLLFTNCICCNLLYCIRLVVVREEKDALADALERLRAAGTAAGSTSDARGLREAVRSLEEQLLRERAKSQRSASKRGQEQRHLMEQVSLFNLEFTPVSGGHHYCNCDTQNITFKCIYFVRTRN